ncbi:MAG TPA: cytochrome c biogenesis protein ResB [Paraburkholderia sp.]|jgi:cytochrome c biogenesis protein
MSLLEILALDQLSRLAVGGGAENDSASHLHAGGYRALTAYIDSTTMPQKLHETAVSVLHTVRGVAGDLWQLSRSRIRLPMRKRAANDDAFVALSVDALSGSTSYGAPVLHQLNRLRQVQASVLHMARAPGEHIAFFGSVMLVASIFVMFYVHRRRF